MTRKYIYVHDYDHARVNLVLYILGVPGNCGAKLPIHNPALNVHYTVPKKMDGQRFAKCLGRRTELNSRCRDLSVVSVSLVLQVLRLIKKQSSTFPLYSQCRKSFRHWKRIQNPQNKTGRCLPVLVDYSYIKNTISPLPRPVLPTVVLQYSSCKYCCFNCIVFWCHLLQQP